MRDHADGPIAIGVQVQAGGHIDGPTRAAHASAARVQVKLLAAGLRGGCRAAGHCNTAAAANGLQDQPVGAVAVGLDGGIAAAGYRDVAARSAAATRGPNTQRALCQRRSGGAHSAAAANGLHDDAHGAIARRVEAVGAVAIQEGIDAAARSARPAGTAHRNRHVG
ncbi:hypothetical protein D3C87_1388810 [compost metagenome]